MNSFEEFWPYYLREHSHPKNRRLHLIGTSVVHVVLFYVFVTGDIKALWLVPIFGYGFAWTGHFFIEKNKPTTFKHPIWSAIADFRVFYLILFKKF